MNVSIEDGVSELVSLESEADAARVAAELAQKHALSDEEAADLGATT